MTDTTETDLVDLLFSQEVADHPHAMYGRLRDQCPVSRTQSDGESALVLISRYQDVLWALRHPEIFSSAGGTVSLGEQPLIPVEVDPPRHTAYRRLLNPQFVPREIERLGPDVQGAVNDLIDGFVDRGSCDFHDDAPLGHFSGSDGSGQGRPADVPPVARRQHPTQSRARRL
jgi:cytochrome P450